MRIFRPRRQGKPASRTARPPALLAALLPVLLAGMLGNARASPPVAPPSPAQPPPITPMPPSGAADAERGPAREARRGAWRNLPPEQREAIRRLSQEQREALANRRWRQGAAPPFGRLSPQERRQLRDQIREDRETRGGGRVGGGKRP